MTVRKNLAIFAAFGFAMAVCPRAQSQQQTGTDESWSSTKENSSQNVNPSRTTESHTKSGNRTVDKQRIEVLGPNGGYQPASETETETVQVNDTTTRTVLRTYQWNGNGQRILSQVTEQESRTTPSGNTHVESKTSGADADGHFQLIQRQVSDTKNLGPGVQETKSTVYRRDSYGGFSQAEQTQELKTQGADDSLAVKKTVLLPDGNGGWQVGGVTETTVKTDGKNRITEERLSGPDLEGRLHEGRRTVSTETETGSGQRKTVETYDGSAQLNKRVTTTTKKDASGEAIEEQVEQPSLVYPGAGASVTARTKYVVKYASPGTQQTTQTTATSEIRDANGEYHVVSSTTQNSTQPPQNQNQNQNQPPPPPKPKPDTSAPKPPDKSPGKP